jgi:hypothetical protein
MFMPDDRGNRHGLLWCENPKFLNLEQGALPHGYSLD